MSEDMWGVFFRVADVEEYLAEVYEDEEEAIEAAEARDQLVFEQEMEEGGGEIPRGRTTRGCTTSSLSPALWWRKSRTS